MNRGTHNPANRAVRVFCAYSHRDQPYREQLVTHLSGLVRDGLIELWFDRMISPGVDWNSEIASQLDSAEIVVLLLSADFAKSEYCVGVEMKRAQERADRNDIRAVPVFIRPFHWPNSPLHRFQGLPSNGLPVKKWKDRDDAYVDIVRGLEIVASEVRESASAGAHAASPSTVSAAGGGFSSVKFDQRDVLGWMGSTLSWWRKLAKYKWRDPDPSPAPLSGTARLALFGDWGTGLYGAPVISRSISNDPRGWQLVLHLGDTFYSGTAAEIRDRLMAPWPSVPGAASRALCGNHEMYSGGTAYIEAVSSRFGQKSSAFAFHNDHWLLACLDTAYEDADLHGNQAAWLQHLVEQAGGRRLILFTHHPPVSQFEQLASKVTAKLMPLLESRKVFAWYWAHEHACAIYEPHTSWGFLGRCAGHGGFPYFRRALPGGRADLTQFVRLAAKGQSPAMMLLDGPNPDIAGSGATYGPHGYFSLEFDGPKLTETVHAADGSVLREERLA